MQYPENTFFSTHGTFIKMDQTKPIEEKNLNKIQRIYIIQPTFPTVKLGINNEKLTKETPYFWKLKIERHILTHESKKKTTEN